VASGTENGEGDHDEPDGVGDSVPASMVWSTAATDKELSPGEIYDLAAPAVVMVMGYAEGVGKRQLPYLDDEGVDGRELTRQSLAWSRMAF
jgi:hypothetical protein